MTTEETYNFDMDNEYTEMAQGVADLVSVIGSNGGCGQEVKRKLRLGRVAVEGSGKITTNTGVSLVTNGNHTLISPATLLWYESWPLKMADRKKKWFILNTSSEESSIDTQDRQTDNRVGPRANGTWNSDGGKNYKAESVLLQTCHGKSGFFGKKIILDKIEGRRKWGSSNMI